METITEFHRDTIPLLARNLTNGCNQLIFKEKAIFRANKKTF